VTTRGESPSVYIIAARSTRQDFITVGLLVVRLGLGGEEHLMTNLIYIQEPDVQVGNGRSYRLEPVHRAQPVGLEYFRSVADALRARSDHSILAAMELTTEQAITITTATSS
jgi:hypothetical protein